MATSAASTLRRGDVLTSPGGDALILTGPHRSNRAPGKVNFLIRRLSDEMCFTLTVADTDQLNTQKETH